MAVGQQGNQQALGKVGLTDNLVVEIAVKIEELLLYGQVLYGHGHSPCWKNKEDSRGV